MTSEESRLVELRQKRAQKTHFHIEAVFAGIPAWKVNSESGGTYRVLLPSFPQRDGAQCSCPDFTRRGLGTCKHIEAAIAYAALNQPKVALKGPPFSVEWETLAKERAKLLKLAKDGNMGQGELERELRRLGRLLTTQ